ncbi:MAG TPA: methyltransferase [Ilumatobacteraceae bacterium]|nr:methyltransferase [Ilumatobacteraceae bacterium]
MSAHYFDDDPAVGSAPKRVELIVAGQTLQIDTDRGVFGYGVVDRGTRYLIDHAPAPPTTGDLLDLGCGSGAIALALATRSPGAHVWAVDVNARARALCAANAALNGVTTITTIDGLDGVDAAVQFDAIWSNPPIRVGKAVLHEMLLTWLPRLRPGGTATLVVHKHLGSDSLQRWLDTQRYPTTRLSSHAGYRLLRCERAD